MAQTMPIVRDRVLTYQWQGENRRVVIGTVEWEQWLVDAQTFIFEHEPGTFTARKERAGNGRGGWYWRAYHKDSGALHRLYIGKTEDLTLTRLEEVALLLTQRLHPGHEHVEHLVVRRLSEQDSRKRQRGEGNGHGKWKNPGERKSHRILLKTKLSVPPVRMHLVIRTHLLTRLRGVMDSALTLISAPAGFGKTTLLSEWIASMRGEINVGPAGDAGHGEAAARDQQPAIAWLSLDEGDNDPTSFWSYFIAALESVYEGIGDDAQLLLSSAQSLPVNTILTVLINAMSALAHNIVLVLDDYHLIETQAVHDGLAFFLEHRPAHMHLVIASRADPPLPLARLRACGQLYELRTSDLRFSAQETRAFFVEGAGVRLADEDLDELRTRCEGWVAGLQLAALALREDGDVALIARTFSGSHRHIIDYLASEVLARQPEAVRAFLLQTSVLDRLNGSLCDALLTGRDSQEMLTLLERKNLFLIPLDSQREWYRYHHLFAAMLRNHLRQEQPERMAALQRRASGWYEQHGLLAEAIGHALQAEDFARVATLIERMAQATYTIWGRSELIRVQGWLTALPFPLLQARPQLCLLYAYVQLFLSLMEQKTDTVSAVQACETSLQNVAQNLSTGVVTNESQVLQGELAALCATVAFIKGDVIGAAEQGKRALALLPQEHTILRVQAAQALANAYRVGGDKQAAQLALDELAHMSQVAQDVYSVAQAMYNLAQLQVMRGNLRQAATTYQKAIGTIEQKSLRFVAGGLYIGLSCILLEWLDVEGAEQYLLRGMERTKTWSDPGLLEYGAQMLAMLRWAQGDFVAAFAALDELERLYQQHKIFAQSSLRAVAYELVMANRARLHLAQGDIASVNRWAQTRRETQDEELSPLHLVEQSVMVRVHLANKRPEEALRLVARLLEVAERAQRYGETIMLYALQALALSLQGNADAARVSLLRALSLAEPGNYLFTFACEGVEMKALLTALSSTLRQGDEACSTYSVSPAYVHRLLASFAKLEGRAAGLQTSTRALGEAQATAGPLSRRELEVLRLLAVGLSDREVAQRLILAESTVKTHVKRIYAKLNVKNRAQAVASASARHLL